MINYIEKKGLSDAIAASGHWIKCRDGVFYSSDDVAVQAIIDSYDPLPLARAEAKARIVSQLQAVMQDIEDAYPEFEKKTWPYQRLEVEAYRANNLASTPVIDAIALAGSLDRVTLINSIGAKMDAYDASANALIGVRKALFNQIDAEPNWKAVETINYS